MSRTSLAEVAGRHGLVEPFLDLVVDELHEGVVLEEDGEVDYHGSKDDQHTTDTDFMIMTLLMFGCCK